MKKILFPLIVLLGFFYACGGFQVKVENDEFKKAKVISLDIWHKLIQGSLDNRRALYTCEVKDGVRGPSEVRFLIRFSEANWGGISIKQGINLDPDAFVLIDGDTTKVTMTDLTSEHGISGGFWTTSSYADMQGVIKLTADMERKMKTAKEIKYRFSVRGTNAVFQADEEQLLAMREFFNAK